MRRGRGAVLWVGLVAVLLLFAIAVGGQRVDGPPLDPRSTGPLGARGLVLLLEDLGADVVIGEELPTDPDAVVLVLDDRLGGYQRGQLRTFVDRGGRLVVADPHSTLAAPVTGSTSLLGPLDAAPIDPGTCDVRALDGLGAVEPGTTLLLRARARDRSCYGDGAEAYVVVTSSGDGVIVSLGGAGALVNERLGDGDNAALAAALLAPEPGTTVVIPQPVLAVESDQSLLDAASDLVGPGVPWALLQLLVAFVLYALHRARRLGRPVPEPQPVAIAGSELVLAVGRLLAQSGDPQAAAALVRHRLRREVAERTGVPADADAGVLVDALAPLTTRTADEVRRAVVDDPVADDAQLLELVALVDDIRQEVLHGRRATAR